MRLLQFLAAARRQTRERPQQPELGDPLRALVSCINEAPAARRSVVLRQVVSGLHGDRADFRESDVYALDASTIAILDALMKDLIGGRYTPADLRHATRSLSEI